VKVELVKDHWRRGIATVASIHSRKPQAAAASLKPQPQASSRSRKPQPHAARWRDDLRQRASIVLWLRRFSHGGQRPDHLEHAELIEQLERLHVLAAGDGDLLAAWGLRLEACGLHCE
jgi:hypothetical protein